MSQMSQMSDDLGTCLKYQLVLAKGQDYGLGTRYKVEGSFL
jgi:hypothetical protein